MAVVEPRRMKLHIRWLPCLCTVYVAGMIHLCRQIGYLPLVHVHLHLCRYRCEECPVANKGTLAGMIPWCTPMGGILRTKHILYRIPTNIYKWENTFTVYTWGWEDHRKSICTVWRKMPTSVYICTYAPPGIVLCWYSGIRLLSPPYPVPASAVGLKQCQPRGSAGGGGRGAGGRKTGREGGRGKGRGWCTKREGGKMEQESAAGKRTDKSHSSLIKVTVSFSNLYIVHARQ